MATMILPQVIMTNRDTILIRRDTYYSYGKLLIHAERDDDD